MQLITFYPTANNRGAVLPKVDVVLVHGLDSLHDTGENGRIKTWTAEDGTVWPRDMLPKCMPDARVLCYEYNGSIKGTTSVAGIRAHANALLRHLEDRRRGGVQVQGHRPIIFVGHNLGGVIIKQALIFARLGRSHKHLAEATSGIVFFATPHHLSGPGGGKLFVTRLLHALGNPQAKIGLLSTIREALQPVEPSAKMIEDIENNGDELTNINEDFLVVLDSFSISLVNFIEATVTEGLDAVTSRRDAVVVNKQDGYLPGADTQFLAGNHVGICKFSNKDDSEWERFRPVSTALRRLADKGLGVANGIEAKRAALLNSLCSTQFHDYSSNIHPTNGTGRWIGRTRAFESWQARTNSRLWIHGKPAAGKTYLAKHIVNQVRAEGSVQVVDCFLDARVKERNSCEAVLRATIHQVATEDAALWARVIDRAGVRQQGDERRDWTRQELIDFWPNIMAEAAQKGNGLAIVLDGFDNIPREDQTDFLSCLDAGQSNLGDQARGSIRIIVLSRWCGSLVKRGFAEYEIVEEDTADDIRCTVRNELGYFAHLADYSGDFQESLCESVTSGAKGIYLWATVMIADIGIRMPDQRQLQEQLKKLPKSLAELYDSILGMINESSESAGPITRWVLLWVVFGLEPLELRDLNLALALTEVWEEDCERAVTQEFLKNRITPAEVFRPWLYNLCGQLLRLSATDHVQPVHSTLTEYLTTNPRVFKNKKWKVPNHDAFHLSEQAAHRDLGRMCAAYLMLPQFVHTGEAFTPTEEGRAKWETKVQDRIEDYPLVRYAALCWLKHVSLAGPVQPSPENEVRDTENQMILRDMATGYGTSWFEVWWFGRKWRARDFPVSATDFESLMADVAESQNALVPPKEVQATPRRGRDRSVPQHSAGSVETLVDSTANDKVPGANPPPTEGPGIGGNPNTTVNETNNHCGYVASENLQVLTPATKTS